MEKVITTKRGVYGRVQVFFERIDPRPACTGRSAAAVRRPLTGRPTERGNTASLPTVRLAALEQRPATHDAELCLCDVPWRDVEWERTHDDKAFLIECKKKMPQTGKLPGANSCSNY